MHNYYDMATNLFKHPGICLGKKGFYQDVENTPDWFPQDIAFRAPTHKHGMTIAL